MFWYLMTTVLRMFAKISENIREHSDVMASLNGLGRIWHACTGSRADPTLSAPGPGPLPGLGSPRHPAVCPSILDSAGKKHEATVSSKCKVGFHLKSGLIRGLFRLLNRSLLLLFFSIFKIVFTFDCVGSSLLGGLSLSCGEWVGNCLVAGLKLLTAVTASADVEYGLRGCSTRA